MIHAVGGVITIDDAVAVAIGSGAAGYCPGRGRCSRDLFLLGAGGERQRAKARQHDGLKTHIYPLFECAGKTPERTASPRRLQEPAVVGGSSSQRQMVPWARWLAERNDL